MLGQGVDLIQRLALTRPFPVAFELGLMKQRPLANEPRWPGGQRTFDQRAVERARRLIVTVTRVKVRNLMRTFVPVHRDHDPEERADARHRLMLASPADGVAQHLLTSDKPPHASPFARGRPFRRGAKPWPSNSQAPWSRRERFSIKAIVTTVSAG